MTSPKALSVTGYVLAGGQSRRMGGVHKALIEHDGKALFQYAVANLRTCCDDVHINTHRDQPVFLEAGFSVVEDGEFQGFGPVAGVHAALHHAATPYVAIAACDQLALPSHVYQTLVNEASDSLGAYGCSNADVVPTCAVLPKSLQASARSALVNGDLSLMAFMHTHARPVKFDEVEFANLNHPQQVTKL